MSQQINLLARKRSEFGLLWIPLAVLGLALAVLLAIWAQGQRELASVRAAEAVSMQQLQAARAQLQARTQQSGADMAGEIAALRQRAEAARGIQAQIDGLGSSQGHARHFAALAGITEEGLWLSGVNVTRGGKSVSLNGYALRKESVMRYAQRLNARFAAEAIQFTSLELTPAAFAKPGEPGPIAGAVAFKLSDGH